MASNFRGQNQKGDVVLLYEIYVTPARQSNCKHLIWGGHACATDEQLKIKAPRGPLTIQNSQTEVGESSNDEHLGLYSRPLKLRSMAFGSTLGECKIVWSGRTIHRRTLKSRSLSEPQLVGLFKIALALFEQDL